MNELQNPWSQWIAEPDFASQLFYEDLDTKTKNGPILQGILGTANPAAELEPIIRRGIQKFVRARIQEGTNPEKSGVDGIDALNLLRPLFCDESINYVSEQHRTGILPSSVWIDDSTRTLMATALPASNWSWQSSSYTIPPANAKQQGLTLIGVRGVSTEAIELGLVARGILSAEDVLRVRAIDWLNPVDSDLRCKIFAENADRLKKVSAAQSEQYPVNEVAPFLLDQLLVDYPIGKQGQVVARRSQSAPSQYLSLEEFGDLLDKDITRRKNRRYVEETRRYRACRLQKKYASASLLPDITCN